MLKKSWLFLLPLVASLMWIGTSPSQAAGENWVVKSVDTVGCASSNWGLTMTFSGLDSGSYTAHTLVEAGGLTYMNEDVTQTFSNGDIPWHLYNSSSYGPATGTYPIPAGQQMKVTFTVERPKGTVLSSYTLVAKSCDSTTLLYNGPTSADTDGDFVVNTSDQCPALQGFTADGCPVRDRTLTLSAKQHPRRVVGTISAPGFPALSAGRIVTIWKVRPGPDLKVRTRVTNSLGKFRARLGKGRYYATTPDFVAPTSGEAAADISNRVRVR